MTLLKKLEARRSNFTLHLQELYNVEPSLQKSRPLTCAEEPPWREPPVMYDLHLPGVYRKGNLPGIVLRQIAEEVLSSKYPGALQVYTDGSVHFGTCSATAAFVISKENRAWSGRFQAVVSSTTAELKAIEKALNYITSHTPQTVVLVTDSRTGLQRLGNPDSMDETTATIQLTLKHLYNSGFNIAFQWVPSHVGLFGNSEADKLAGAAHGLPRTIPSPTDFNATRKSIKSYITELSPTRYSKHQPCITKGLKREKCTLLIRIRSRSAFTNAFLFKISAIKSSQCPNCNDEESICHILFNCEEDSDPRHRPVRH